MIELNLKDTFEQPYLIFPSTWTMAQAIDWAVDRNLEGEWVITNKAHYGLFVTSPVSVHQIDPRGPSTATGESETGAQELRIGDEVKFDDLAVGRIGSKNTDGTIMVFMLDGTVRHGGTEEVTKL